MICDKCNLGSNFPTSRVSYKIINYPKFLFVLFDFRSYYQLDQTQEALKKLYIENLNITEKDRYFLKGCVTSPSYNHFTFFINKLNMKDNINDLELEKNYYYDDQKFNGNFQLYNNNDIYEIFNHNIFPYILIYEKF